MFLRAKKRFKDGKEHCYWSIVENRRVQGNRVVQRPVLYLGEINGSQQAAWCRTIEVFDEGASTPRQLALFPEDRKAPALDGEVVRIRLGASCNCAIPANGAPVGWRVSCGINSNWMISGATNYLRAANGRGGLTCSKHWFVIDSLRPAVSGTFTATGLTKVRWGIDRVRILV